jgi:AmmeMemoRadiSam system protein A
MEPLTDIEKQVLLQLARQTLQTVIRDRSKYHINLESYTPRLQKNGASFVTLTRHEALRGCIGTLEAYQPLVQDVCEHAEAAALEDYRFPPVRPEELDQIQIEVSVLTPAVPFEYSTPDELIERLRPGIDGVVLRDGMRRATFLPQVWEQLPEPEMFLSHLCAKMGAASNLWQKKVLQVSTYQVEEFHE